MHGMYCIYIYIIVSSLQVIEKERKGDYLGKTVQTIPHLTDAIIEWIERVAKIPVDGSTETPDVCIIEVSLPPLSPFLFVLFHFSWEEPSET